MGLEANRASGFFRQAMWEGRRYLSEKMRASHLAFTFKSAEAGAADDRRARGVDSGPGVARRSFTLTAAAKARPTRWSRALPACLRRASRRPAGRNAPPHPDLCASVCASLAVGVPAWQEHGKKLSYSPQTWRAIR